MSKTKKSLLASAVSLLVCLALLTGTTFAWFTDSISSTGNSVESGELQFDVKSYQLADGKWGSPVLYAQFGKQPLIQADNWEPGQYGAIMLKIKNTGSVAMQVSLSYLVKDAGLSDALWYRIQSFISPDGAQGEKALDMLSQSKISSDQLNSISDAASMSTMGQSSYPAAGAEDIIIYPANSGQAYYAYILLEYGMYTDADDTFQGKNFTLDIVVNATQATVETDGFGNSNYDAGASYDFVVADGTQLSHAIAVAESGDVIGLSQDITMDSPLILYNAKDIVLDLGNHELSIPFISIYQDNGKSDITIKNGTISGVWNSDSGYGLVDVFGVVQDLSALKVTLRNVNIDVVNSEIHYAEYEYPIKFYYCTPVLENVTANGKITFTDSTGIIEGGNFSAPETENFLINTNFGLTVNGGTFTASGENQIIFNVSQQNNYPFVINNGVFNYGGQYAIHGNNPVAQGYIVVNGGTFNSHDYAKGAIKLTDIATQQQ